MSKMHVLGILMIVAVIAGSPAACICIAGMALLACD